MAKMNNWKKGWNKVERPGGFENVARPRC